MKRLGKLGAVLGAALVVIGGCTMPPVPVPPSPITFTTYVVDAALPGAAFVVNADVVGGPEEELIGTGFVNAAGGPGYVSIYERTGGLGSWSRTDVVTPADGIRFPHEPAVADLDNDGDADFVLPGGFFSCAFSGPGCGTLTWWEQDGANWIRHDIIPPNQPQFFFRAILVDVDLDGIDDIVTVGETSSTATTMWFKGTNTSARFESTPRIIGAGGGSLPRVEDVDNDGDLDVISPQLFQAGVSYAWFERTADPSIVNPAGLWTYHIITSVVGGGFEIEKVPNLYGDSVDRWVGTNHVNTNFTGPVPESAVYLLDPATPPTLPWSVTKLSSGILARPTNPTLYAPGVLGYGDIDGDGDVDLAVSGDGDARLFWLQQQPDNSFTTYVLAENMGQSGGALVTDLDNDGKAEMVFASYEQGVVKIYEAP